MDCAPCEQGSSERSDPCDDVSLSSAAQPRLCTSQRAKEKEGEETIETRKELELTMCS